MRRLWPSVSPASTAAPPDGVTLMNTAAVHAPDRHAPRMRTPDLNGGTGGFGRPMVNRLARATAVTHRASGGKTVRARLAW